MERNLLSASDVGNMAGVSRVSVWKAARAGDIYGATRTPGGHFRFPPKSAEAWAMKIIRLRRERDRRRAVARRARLPSKESLKRGSNSGIPNVEGLHGSFERWLRRCPAKQGNRIFEGWWRGWSVPLENCSIEQKHAIFEELRIIAEFSLLLASDLGVKLRQLGPPNKLTGD
jgi:hypothetical protein